MYTYFKQNFGKMSEKKNQKYSNFCGVNRQKNQDHLFPVGLREAQNKISKLPVFYFQEFP